MRLSGGQASLLMALLLLLTCLHPGRVWQPRGQFSHPNIADLDAIWLLLAHSDATQSFTAPQRTEDTPVPANLPQRGCYVTLRANRALYDGRYSPMTRGCHHPLPGPGPYRVKFLVVRDRGPAAETEWSSETRLQQAEALQAAPGPQSAGPVVMVAILSVLLAVPPSSPPHS